MTFILVFILILSILVFVHELGHFAAAKFFKVKVEEFGIGFPPRVWGVKKGETLYSINALPIGGFVKLYGEEYHEEDGDMKKEVEKDRAFIYKKPWKKAIILVAGVTMNFFLGWIIVTYLFTRGIPTPTDQVIIESIAENSPAQQVGLQAGDQIIRLESESQSFEINRVNELISATDQLLDQEINLYAQRDSQELMFSLTPRSNPPEGQGALGVVLDVEASFTIESYPFYTAPFAGLAHIGTISTLIFTELGKTVGNLVTLQAPEVQVAGPIGIAVYTRDVITVGFDAVLELVALLSINLAIINLLPFPALDGGRLIFVAYEWIFKKPVNRDFERNLNFFGIATLLLLTVVITYIDIMRLIQ